MAVFNPHFRFLFLAEPYSASRSVHAALMKIPGSESVGWHHEKYQNLIATWKYRDYDFPDVIKFCIVRNPFDRLVTQFHHLTSWHYAGFDKFVQVELANRRTIYVHPPDCDAIILFDDLECGLSCVLQTCDIDLNRYPLELSHLGKTLTKRDWRDYYTPHLMKFVKESLDDFRTYNFDDYL